MQRREIREDEVEPLQIEPVLVEAERRATVGEDGVDGPLVGVVGGPNVLEERRAAGAAADAALVDVFLGGYDPLDALGVAKLRVDGVHGYAVLSVVADQSRRDDRRAGVHAAADRDVGQD